MARRGRFGSLLLYIVGLLLIGGAAIGGLRLWQAKDSQLLAARQAMAEGVALGPAVQIATINLLGHTDWDKWDEDQRDTGSNS